MTIFGESAGAFSVDQLIRSDLATPFFNRAIGQSGCLVSTWTCQTEQNWQNCQQAYLQHFNVTTSNELIDKLRELSFNEMLSVESQLRQKGHGYLTRIDGLVLTDSLEPHKRPYIMGTVKSSLNLSYCSVFISGRTQSEGEYLLSSKLPFLQKGALSLDDFRHHVKRFLSAYELLPQDTAEQQIIIEKVKVAYGTEDETDYTAAFARWFGDLLIGAGVKLYGILT